MGGRNGLRTFRRLAFGCLLFGVLSATVTACKDNEKITEADVEQVKLSKSTQALADAVAKDNFIGTEFMGRMPEPSPSYQRRMKLMSEPSEEELLELTGYPNAVVNCVAFEALYDQNNKVVPELFKAFMERENKIQYIQGDISKEIPMLEYIYTYVMKYTLTGETLPEQLEASKPKVKLSPAQMEKAELRIESLRASYER